MKNIRFPLFYKLFATFILCSTIPLAIIGGSMYGLSVEFLNKTIYDQTYSNIEVAHERINKKINEYEDIIEKLQKNDDIINSLILDYPIDINQNEIYEIIYESLIEQKIKPFIYITDTTGGKIFSTTALTENYIFEVKNNWGIFRAINESYDETVLYPQQSTDLQNASSILSMGAKIMNNDGVHVGYVLIDIPREVILDEIMVVNSGLSLHVVMMDKNEYTLLDTKNSNMEGKFQKSSYIDFEKDSEHKNIRDEIEKNSFLTVNFIDKRLETLTIVNVSSNIFEAFEKILKLILLFGTIISLSISGVISFVVASRISNPINELITIMGKVEEGDLNVRAASRSNDEIGDLGKYFNQMLDRLHNYMNKIIEKQQQLRKTEIKMLQAQIKPHFIYNTLDVVKWSAKLGEGKEVVSVVTNLAKILRFSIDCDEEFVEVGRSMAVINSYLKIQMIKYNNSFKVINNIDKSMLQYKIPRLILQPLIENAIVHGLVNNKGDGEITISSKVNEGVIEFQIIDNGIGMTSEEIQKISENKSDQHIGVHNVDQRIKLYYSDDYGVHIESRKFKGTKVIVTLPCIYEGELL